MKRRLLWFVAAPLVALVLLAALAVGLLQSAEVDALQLAQSLLGPGTLPAWLVGSYEWLRLPLRVLFVVAIFLLVWLVTKVSGRLAGWLMRVARYDVPAAPPDEAAPMAPAEGRYETIRLLLASLINIGAFVTAFILAAGQFVSLVNLAVISTILANAFGFAARDYIGDLLNGVSNIFEDRFDVGDNVSVFRAGDPIEGIVERVTVRTLTIRTRAGELIIVPQGEVRILRNYSRGSFTGTAVTVRVAPADLPAALAILTPLAAEAPALLPDLLEPWRVVAPDGTLGSAAELLLHAKARYGHGVELRLQIMALVEERLAAAGVALAS
mgnify:CR=1 FL=1